MRRVKRTAITVKPKQPYIEWANGLEEGGVKLGEEYTPELNVYLVEDIADAILVWWTKTHIRSGGERIATVLSVRLAPKQRFSDS